MYVISLSTKTMNIETYRNHCLRKKGDTEEFPFGESTLVYKVMDKMFVLTNIDTFASIHLKMDGSIPDKMIYQWIDTSYELVIGGYPKDIENDSSKKPSEQ